MLAIVPNPPEGAVPKLKPVAAFAGEDGEENEAVAIGGPFCTGGEAEPKSDAPGCGASRENELPTNAGVAATAEAVLAGPKPARLPFENNS